MFLVNLVIGDKNHNGHGRTETISIFSNITPPAMRFAYEIGSKIVGFDFVETVCFKFGDPYIYREEFDKLVSKGFCADLIEDGLGIDKKLRLTPNEFSIIYLFIVRLGAPDFQYFVQTGTQLDIGGYGLFSEF